MDFEASYRTSLSAINDSWDGDLSLRLVATHVLALKQLDQTLSISTGAIGQGGNNAGGAPSWNGQLSVSYSNDPIRFNWTTRYISSGKMFADMIQCTSGCPTPVPPGVQTIDYNFVPSYYATDISLAYAFFRDGNRNAEVFLNVDNLFDRDPPPVAQSGVAYAPMTNPSLYDVYGRSFRAGVRFKM
jgi:outer membrane receptor protein involved in Fe transport